VEVSDFQDVEGFLRNGGQRGPQRRILREGTYAINLVQFMEALLTMLLSDRFSALANKEQGQRSEEAEKLRTDIRNSMKDKKE
jgi:hypothetical protein